MGHLVSCKIRRTAVGAGPVAQVVEIVEVEGKLGDGMLEAGQPEALA